MSKELSLYKDLIDGLVKRQDSMSAQQIKANGALTQSDINQAKNAFIASLSPAQRMVLCELLQDEHIAGMHDTLAYLNEMMDLQGLKLIQDGVSLPNDYFESLHYDFICRSNGDDWPE